MISGHSKKSRLKQLIDWCGGETFDGCLVFDECHKAKNFIPVSSYKSTEFIALNFTMSDTNVKLTAWSDNTVYSTSTAYAYN